MNALQQWYDYVDSVSRPANREDAAPQLTDPARPRPDVPAEASLPDNTIDLGPRFRARSYLAALIAPVEPVPVPEWWLGRAGPEPELPELRFEPVSVALPRFRDYVAASPRDDVPWDGDAKAWVAAVAAAVARAERAHQPAPPPPPPAPAPERPLPPAAVALAVSSAAAPAPETMPPPETGCPPAVAPAVPAPAAAPPVDFVQLHHLKAGVQSREGLRDLPPTAEVAQHSYKQPFRESRDALVQRLLDPPLTLEETARLLGVCPTTVRRYTNRGALKHFRTSGNQRRFRLSDVLAFMEAPAAGEDQEDPACDTCDG